MKLDGRGQIDHSLWGNIVCGPVTLAVVAIGAALASTAVSVVGSIQSANAQASAANYQAQVAANNQTIANNEAAYASQAGEVQAQQQELQTKAVIGNQLAAQASNGLDVNSGSNVTVRSSTAALGNFSAMTIRNNAARQAYGYKVAGISQGEQSQLDSSAAANAQTAGVISAVGDVAGGIGKGVSSYTAINNAFGTNTTASAANNNGPNYNVGVPMIVR